MLKNYLKIAFRTLIRHKGYSAINLFGLTVGLACTILITLWIRDELGYDQFHQNRDNIYRVILSDKTYQPVKNYPVTPPPLAASLKQDFPEVRSSVRFYERGFRLVSLHDHKFKERISFTDPDIFDIFTFDFISGDPVTALTSPFSMIISESMAQKYFGNSNPLNKALTVDNQFAFKITGIIRDFPKNSSLKTDFIVPFEQLKILNGEETRGWVEWSVQTFVLLESHVDAAVFEQKITDYPDKVHDYTWKPTLTLQSFADIHLKDINGGGMILFICIFALIAVFILLIACINFMNLATARSSLRSKEIGLRKVIGAVKQNLMGQFFGEAIILAFLALFFGIFLTELLLPVFNDISGKTLTLDLKNSPSLIPILIGMTLLTGLVAGSYPALYLSAIQPIYALKGSKVKGPSLLRKVLVVFQFFLSVVLIFSTIVISRQMHFIANRYLGFNRDHMVYVPMNPVLRTQFDFVKNELEQQSGILSVCAVSSYLGIHAMGSFDVNKWDGNNGEKSILVNILTSSCDFPKTFDIPMQSGRYFSKAFATDTTAIILNETAVRHMGLEHPIGTKILDAYTVIGVIHDFNFESLKSEIKPLSLFFNPRDYQHLAVKIDGARTKTAIHNIEKVTNRFSPDFPFEYQFLDEQFSQMYQSEQQLEKIFNAFALLAILISCLGLIGLASFSAQRRTKEMGVRKVLGSSVSEIILLLAGDFTRLIIVSNLIAWPVSWFIMNSWLQDFTYRTHISWWIFVVSGVISLLIALLSVIFQAIHAAIANPIDALRYE